jgi:8-oxo-dGTP pyrophosphatase MutT (NUDIX family)
MDIIGQKEPEYTMNVAAAIIVRERDNVKEVLLIKRSKDDHWPLFWEYPRGKCDHGEQESLLTCVKREVKEETGLDIDPIKLVGIYEYIADKGKRRSICHNFLCRLIDPTQKVKLSNEHRTFQWIRSFGQAELMLVPDQKKILAKVFNTGLSVSSYPVDNKVIDQVQEYLSFLQEA